MQTHTSCVSVHQISLYALSYPIQYRCTAQTAKFLCVELYIHLGQLLLILLSVWTQIWVKKQIAHSLLIGQRRWHHFNMTTSTSHVMMNNTVLRSMNTVTWWDSLDVLLAQLIVYTLAGTSALLANNFTSTQAKKIFHPLHDMMRSSLPAKISFQQFLLAILVQLGMIKT